MKKWISVEEQLPEENQDVIITDGNKYAVGYWREDANSWERQSDDEVPIKLGKVTHWQPFELYEKE